MGLRAAEPCGHFQYDGGDIDGRFSSMKIYNKIPAVYAQEKALNAEGYA